jgi:hypothetical protein
MQMLDHAAQAATMAEALRPILKAADNLGFEEAARHIDAAILALGGEGTPPPNDGEAGAEGV